MRTTPTRSSCSSTAIFPLRFATTNTRRKSIRPIARPLSGKLLIDPHEAPALGWVAVEHERIAAMGTGEPPTAPDAGGPDCLICPGFIDAHLHLPQIDVVGCDGMELLEWLERVIFPAELRWADERWAGRQISEAYGQMLRAGTLGYAGYLTSHLHGLVELVRAAHRLPLRARVGQVLMDRHAPAVWVWVLASAAGE